MNTPRYAAAAAKLLGKHVPKSELVTGDRERGIATIERAMQARSGRRRLIWATSACAVAAALALTVQTSRWLNVAESKPRSVAIGASPSGRGAALYAGDRREPLQEGAQLGSGQRIETPIDGGASLKLSTGTSMDLEGSASFGVDSQDAVEHFSLQRGGLSAHVAKLGAGQRFIVATPDAEVEVRGTRFRVSVVDAPAACGQGSRTRLVVTEGVVEVRGPATAVMVRAGEHWPADCSLEPAAPNVPAAADQGSKPGASAEAPAAEATSGLKPVALDPRPAADRASALTEQNDAFAEALALRRRGDVAGALRAYQNVITRFPHSALAENATVSRMRLLAASHDARAKNEAQLYLTRYPAGFAVKEAEKLVTAP